MKTWVAILKGLFKTKNKIDTMSDEFQVADGAALLRLDYGSKSTMAQLIEKLAGTAEAATLRSLRIGAWESCYEAKSSVALDPLVKHAGAFPQLESLFFAEIEQEECEISWINHVDLGPLFGAFPNLKSLQIRGGNGLRLSGARHARLQTLRIETGGLPSEAVVDVAGGDFPELEHLELWLGCDEYGGTATVQDLGPLLNGSRLPSLKFLGLMNWEKANDLAGALKGAPVLTKIETLDLSMGTLTDIGAEALLHNAALKDLKQVNVSDNYVSDAFIGKLKAMLGQALVVGNQEEPDEYEYKGVKYSEVYCSVSE